LWAWFEEDRLLSELGHERLHTTSDGPEEVLAGLWALALDGGSSPS
jgi:hypothetical protein